MSQTIANVLQELSPGRRNSLAFVDGNVSGRDLFITTRKSPAKRRPRKKSEAGDTPKRGRPKKRDSNIQSVDETETPTAKRTASQSTPHSDAPEEIHVVAGTGLDLSERTEESHLNGEDTQQEETRSAYRSDDEIRYEEEGGFGDSQCDFETPTRNYREQDSPLPVEPYHSFRSSPPSSPVYEEYQVPIPTSSSPVRPSDPHTPRPPTPQSPLDNSRVLERRRARSRSASRERRMSIAPVPPWQGLPSTPRRSAFEDSEVVERDLIGSQSTEPRSPTTQSTASSTDPPQPTFSEGMTPVRNWAAQVTEGAFQFDTSPGKLAQLRISRRLSTAMPEDEEDEEDEETFLPQNGDSVNDTERSMNFAQDNSTLQAKQLPQISRVRVSPIVITSSPPLEPEPIHYKWKTVVGADLEDHISDLNISENELDTRDPTNHEISDDDDISEPETSRSQSRYASRQSSPARSILTELGADVISISSVNQWAVQQAAHFLLRSPHYSKVTFDDDYDQKIWQDAMANAGDYELSKIEEDLQDVLDDPIDLESAEQVEDEENDEAEKAEEKEENVLGDLANVVRAPPRISQGEWTKVDWKRMEKCLDRTRGDMNDAITLFLERYVGRERAEVEMRCRAVLLARRRRVLEGKKVGFILSTHE